MSDDNQPAPESEHAPHCPADLWERRNYYDYWEGEEAPAKPPCLPGCGTAQELAPDPHGRMKRALERKEMLSCYTVANEIYAPLQQRVAELEVEAQRHSDNFDTELAVSKQLRKRNATLAVQLSEALSREGDDG